MIHLNSYSADPAVIIIVLTIVVALSSLLTYVIIKYAGRNKLIAIPNERSLHAIPTPTGGGIAITFTWFLGIILMYSVDIIDRDLFYALLSGIILALVSLFDDLKDLKPYIRLITQFITVILAVYFLHGLKPLFVAGIVIPFSLFTYPIIIIGMVWFVNLFNFMDGSDGLASVEAIIVSFVLFVFTRNIVNLLIIGCVAGFLIWNWPKAKIFMGDVGSTQLGFILIVLGIYFHNTSDFSMIMWLMLTSAFWFDATLTLYRRWRNGEKLSKAHRKHAYQRLVQLGFSHGIVIACLVFLNLAIILFIVIYSKSEYLQIPAFVLSIGFYYLLIKIIDWRVPFPKD